MADITEKKYDVFISYAHADVQSADSKALVKEIKSGIETALGGRYVFLDSEALKWGDEWSAKIRKCIDNCRVFVYLLSPNYLHSDYCQREKLWWARRETMLGRLNKDTLPIYYIALPKTEEPALMQYDKEHRICQSDGRPFFESVDQVKSDIAHERIREIRESLQGVADIKKLVEAAETAEIGDCTIYPPISRFFVGRLKELAELHEMCCEKRTIPVISGAAGIGKSELAVAYAYAYAENFPQGRFMIPMQGVKDWTTAMDKMVEKIRECGKKPEILGLPEDFAKRPPSERLEVARAWLLDRVALGGVLLLLDNLEETELISDDSILELTNQVGLPSDLHIVATMRPDEGAFSSLNMRNIYEIDPLSDKDALELFCLIGENVFPFAKWPMSGDGKILLGELASGKKRPAAEEIAEIEAEYAAAKEIITLLGGHAWSLEIVAGFMAENFTHYAQEGGRFRKKLEDLQKNPTANIIGHTHRSGKYQDPKKLLQPTFDRLRDFNAVSPELGEHIMYLAAVAAFFPPEQIPLYALKGIWEQKFGSEEIEWDRGTRSAESALFALEQLKRYRIINGDGPILKMHRLTREVLQNSLCTKKHSNPVLSVFETVKKFFCLPNRKNSGDEKLKILKTMEHYLQEFLTADEGIDSQKLLPWVEWGLEWSDKIDALHRDVDFSFNMLRLAARCAEVDMVRNAYLLTGKAARTAKNTDNDNLCAAVLFARRKFITDLGYEIDENAEYADFAALLDKMLGKCNPDKIDPDINKAMRGLIGDDITYSCYDEAERPYRVAVDFLQKQGETDQYVTGLVNLADFLKDHARYDEAEKEYQHALEVCSTNNSVGDHEKMLSHVSHILNRLGGLYRNLKKYEAAEKNYKDSLRISQNLMSRKPEKYEHDVAIAFFNLSGVYYDLGHYDDAEKMLNDSLEHYNRLFDRCSEKYAAELAMVLYRKSDPLFHRQQLDSAEPLLVRTVNIYRDLVKQKRQYEKFAYKYVNALNALASLHEIQGQLAEAEAEYQDALMTLIECDFATERYGEMTKKDPERHQSAFAETTSMLAGLREKQNRFEEAESLYDDVLDIYQELAEERSVKYTPYVADTLNKLACLHEKQKLFDKAEQEYKKALEALLLLTKNTDAADVCKSYIAVLFSNLAKLYQKQNRLDEANDKYGKALEIYQSLKASDPEKYGSEIRKIQDLVLAMSAGPGKEAEADGKISRPDYKWGGMISNANISISVGNQSPPAKK